MIAPSEILALALQLGGAAASRQQDALELLCKAALAEVEAGRLPDAPASEEALLCGMAYLALSRLPEEEPLSFTAGSISVTRSNSRTRSAVYADLASRLLAPYVGESGFAFLGVEG